MIRSFLSSAVFRRRASLLPPGVDVSAYRPGTPRRLRLRAKFRTPEDAIVMGCVAHLVPVKGHPTLLEALSEVPKVILWIAGRVMDETYVDGLKAQARKLGLENRVVFLGGIDDVPALLAELDIFVLPTWDAWRMEGCPVALLEAMASGLACVATDIPGSRDVIGSGQNGLLVPPRNPAALGEAIRRLALDPDMRREMGRTARERVEDRYSIEREVHAYEVLYEEALRVRSVASKPS
jgi:glycosyltransferase involved in cell wall biosynthesis